MDGVGLQSRFIGMLTPKTTVQFSRKRCHQCESSKKITKSFLILRLTRSQKINSGQAARPVIGLDKLSGQAHPTPIRPHKSC